MSKVIFLTGSSSGIGFALLKKLAMEHHQLILPIRNLNQKTEFQDFIKQIEPEPFCFEFDLSDPHIFISNSYYSEIKKRFSQIDILIHNAGIFTRSKRLVNGFELQWVVNFFAPVFITNQLIDLLKNSDFPQILFVSSRIHKMMQIRFDDFNYQKDYSGRIAYANSKFALIAYTFYLADQFPDMYINVCHPGVYETGITRELPPPLSFLWNAFIKEPSNGGEILYQILMNERYNKNKKKYFNQLAIEEAHPSSMDPQIQRQLLEKYNQFLENIQTYISKNQDL